MPHDDVQLDGLCRGWWRAAHCIDHQPPTVSQFLRPRPPAQFKDPHRLQSSHTAVHCRIEVGTVLGGGRYSATWLRTGTVNRVLSVCIQVRHRITLCFLVIVHFSRPPFFCRHRGYLRRTNEFKHQRWSRRLVAVTTFRKHHLRLYVASNYHLSSRSSPSGSMPWWASVVAITIVPVKVSPWCVRRGMQH